MPKKPKRRSVASYRAASLKAARTRRRMKEAWLKELQTMTLYEFATLNKDGTLNKQTINRIPKVEWK